LRQRKREPRDSCSQILRARKRKKDMNSLVGDFDQIAEVHRRWQFVGRPGARDIYSYKKAVTGQTFTFCRYIMERGREGHALFVAELWRPEEGKKDIR
jgi:hypothetical protein